MVKSGELETIENMDSRERDFSQLSTHPAVVTGELSSEVCRGLACNERRRRIREGTNLIGEDASLHRAHQTPKSIYIISPLNPPR
jgi:hypothetical protein